MAKEKRPPLRALAALIRSRTARALPRATPYPLCMLGSPPRHVYAACWHVSLTYLLWALPAAAVPADPAGPAPALPAPRVSAPVAVRGARADRETPQEASLIYIIESSRAFPPSGDPARCAYGKGRT
jgi:hypothetical protein